MTTPARCINIDWLELFCYEPLDEPHTPEYFRACGVYVREREYGTRVYNQMFVVADDHGDDYVEIRREPLSKQALGGFFPPNACHIRLVNRQCYADDAVLRLARWLDCHHYVVQRISRIDICLDFELFDSGDKPAVFLQRYINGKYSKINQANVHAHGTDSWTTRSWNSCSWGSKQSMIGTKFYNKTKELAEVHDKPYIRQAWMLAGLVDNPMTCERRGKDGNIYVADIWRLEFSISSSVKNWLVIERDGKDKNYQSIRNTLQMYDSRDKLLTMFAALQEHYFQFRHYENGKRKWDCKRKQLFTFGVAERFYHVEHPAMATPKNRDYTILKNRLQQYASTCYDTKLRKAANMLIDDIDQRDAMRILSTNDKREELIALQQVIAARLGGADVDPAQMILDLIAKLKTSHVRLY